MLSKAHTQSSRPRTGNVLAKQETVLGVMKEDYGFA